MRKRVIISAALLLAVSIGAVFTACALEEMNGPGELVSVEITEYQGEKLSSVKDFRENSIRGPQHIDIEEYRLQVGGLVEKPGFYTYDQVINDNDSYTKLVTLNCVEGWSVDIVWEGVLVRDLIEKSGVLPEAKTVVFRAYDEYTTSFPIEYLMENDILLAYKMNEITIPPERGFPFQLVAEDKWGYKWIKWVTAIDLIEQDFLGYWESRGYSNDGSLDKSFFEFFE